MASYAVLGATSWGVTLAGLLGKGGHDVDLIVRTGVEAASVAGLRGIERLPEVRLGPAVRPIEPEAARERYEGLIVATPSQMLRASVRALPLARDVAVLSAAKGLEHDTLLRMSEVLEEAGWARDAVAVLSGPNLAHEVARGLPAASVVASTSEALAQQWQRALSHGAFRCYRSSDVVGTELGGALKNIVAIAAGAAAGLNLGANAIAAIMTRGLAEMTRLGIALGANPLTFQGLAGIGDLAATCYSPLSRNHRLGELLATGLSREQALDEIGEIVEGAATAPAALALAGRLGVEMPIAEQVVAVLEGSARVPEAMTTLLTRALRSEVEPHLR
ncbi:MAG TPA: NAD(P)H-dependent glycerol-3-phosphate dehydrogenase [Tepidiformaceae bacterium]|nr:NAD(P)H-dependent glycerol-3-phosphate dehydrogenase [Tepidiformaceae bacterium]